MRKISHSSSGFSLLETIVVLAILAIFAAIGAPHMTSSMSRYRADLAARQIVTDLNFARSHATSSSASQTVAFNPTANTYTLAGIRSLDGRSMNYVVDLSLEPYRCSLVSANFNGTSVVTFDAYGSADNAGRIVVQCDGIQTSVTLEPTNGRATVP